MELLSSFDQDAASIGVLFLVLVGGFVFFWVRVHRGRTGSGLLRRSDRLTHHCDIVETGNESWRFKNRV